MQDVVLAAGEADGGDDGVLAAGEGDVGEQQADEALAFARRGGRVVPEGGEVGRQGVDAGALGGIERDGRRAALAMASGVKRAPVTSTSTFSSSPSEKK